MDNQISNNDTSPKSTIMRILFTRKGKTAYVAHLDMMRIFERAMKRAGVECEYSQGFNPRPVMAFALPLGVGVETTDDYVDIAIQEDINPEILICRLNDSLPEGIEVKKAKKIIPTKASMMAQVVAAQYSFSAPGISSAIESIQNSPVLNVIKIHKGESKTIDAKPLIISAEKESEDSIKVIVKAGSKENLRPDLFLEALAEIGYFSVDDARNTSIVRTGTFFAASDGSFIRPI